MDKPKLLRNLLLRAPNASDFYAGCAVGHKDHETKMAVTKAGYPMLVYKWEDHFTTRGDNPTFPKYEQYCPAQDVISYCIDTTGQWEPAETQVVQDILRETTGKVVLDFGSHIGWYSLMAASYGHQVGAFDASELNLSLLRESEEQNRFAGEIYRHLCQIEDDFPYFSADYEDVHLLKVDVEGAESKVVSACWNLWEYKKIKYAIIEISPVFNDTYPDLVEKICSYGYRVYQLPAQPMSLEQVIAQCRVLPEGRREYVAGLHQENFVFIRSEL